MFSFDALNYSHKNKIKRQHLKYDQMTCEKNGRSNF